MTIPDRNVEDLVDGDQPECFDVSFSVPPAAPMVTNEIRPDCRIEDASESPPSVEADLVALRIVHRDAAGLHRRLIR